MSASVFLPSFWSSLWSSVPCSYKIQRVEQNYCQYRSVEIFDCLGVLLLRSLEHRLHLVFEDCDFLIVLDPVSDEHFLGGNLCPGLRYHVRDELAFVFYR